MSSSETEYRKEVKSMIIKDGVEYVQLPGSNYWVCSEGTLIVVLPLHTKGNKPGYVVCRKGTRKYYSKDQLAVLYRKYSKGATRGNHMSSVDVF